MSVTVTTPPCIQCGKTSEVELPRVGFALWRSGIYVQEAFPGMSADQRELLITGTHPACWELIFPEEDD